MSMFSLSSLFCPRMWAKRSLCSPFTSVSTATRIYPTVLTRSEAPTFHFATFVSAIAKELLEYMYKHGYDYSLGMMIDFVCMMSIRRVALQPIQSLQKNGRNVLNDCFI